jgi:pimeloyl-ACP methyl ester carboxylesterase
MRLALLLAFTLSALAEQRMISIGDRRIATYCEGQGSPAVILIPAGGQTAKDWASVQPQIAAFTRVCSYDHASKGASDKAPVPLQTPDQVVDDLHAWLQAAGEKPPYVLVGHSSSGMYVRAFAARYPNESAGFVFVDGSHEEQALRLSQIDPQGPKPDEITGKLGFYIEPGRKLEWRTDKPLIVIARGTPFERRARDGSNSQTNRMSEEQFAAWDKQWRAFQQDIANRSPKGELRIAEKSGHWPHKEQPEFVIQAIRDVMTKVRN